MGLEPARGGGEDDGILISVMGQTIRLTFGEGLSPEFEAAVQETWAGAVVPSGVPDEIIELSEPGDQERFLEGLSTRVTLAGLAKHKGEMLTFHAAGLALEDGRVVAFVGPSGRGKTTVSRTLGQCFGYVSDETITVDASGRVYPYRKPLSLVRQGAPKRQVSPSEAGLMSLPDCPLQLVSLVLLDRVEDVVAPSIESLPLIDGMLGLLPEMSYMSSFEDPLVRLATLCDRVGGVKKLTYSDVSQLDRGVLEELADASAEGEPWQRVHAMVAAPGDYEMADVLDAVQCGNGVIVINDQKIRVLSGIAPVIWAEVRKGTSLERIIDAVVAVFGEPAEGEAADLVRVAVDSLIEAELLRVVEPAPARGNAE